MTTYVTPLGFVFPNGTSMVTAGVQNGQNLGGVGGHVYWGRSGDVLYFRQLVSGSASLSITANTTHILLNYPVA